MKMYMPIKKRLTINIKSLSIDSKAMEENQLADSPSKPTFENSKLNGV